MPPELLWSYEITKFCAILGQHHLARPLFGLSWHKQVLLPAKGRG